MAMPELQEDRTKREIGETSKNRLQPDFDVHAYKHRWTRCYFHLADDGRAFYYVTDDLYHEVDPYTAIKAVFAEWECCKPTPEERRALRSALGRVAGRDEPE